MGAHTHTIISSFGVVTLSVGAGAHTPKAYLEVTWPVDAQFLENLFFGSLEVVCDGSLFGESIGHSL